MKQNIAYAFLSSLLVAPLLSMGQEVATAISVDEAKAANVAEATEAAPAESTAAAVADTATDVAVGVADAAAESAELVADRVLSVFNRATTPDAWDIRLSVFAMYDDNRDNVPSHYGEDVDERYRYEKEDNTLFGIQPSFAFDGAFAGNQHYRFGYSPIYQYWTNPRVGDKRSELSHAAFVEYSYRPDTRNEFTLRDDFKYIQNDYWYLRSEDVERENYLGKRRAEHEQAHYDNRLSGVWRMQCTQDLSADLRGYWTTIRYDDDDIAATEDEDKYVAILKLSQSLSARFALGVFLKYEGWDDNSSAWTRGEYALREVNRGIQTYTIGVAADYRHSARLSISAKYGWEWVNYEDDGIDDRDFPGDGDISATYAFSLRVKGSLGFRYGVTEAWVYPFASQDLYSFYASLNLVHTQRVTTHYRLTYKISEYDWKYVPDAARTESFEKSHDGEKKELVAEAAINYRWNTSLNLSLSYTYVTVDSDVSYDYDENTVCARATYFF